MSRDDEPKPAAATPALAGTGHRDELLQPGEQWHRIGVDAYVASIGEPPLTRSIDSLELLKLLQKYEHDGGQVHVRLVAGNLVISVASDVWSIISQGVRS